MSDTTTKPAEKPAADTTKPAEKPAADSTTPAAKPTTDPATKPATEEKKDPNKMTYDEKLAHCEKHSKHIGPSDCFDTDNKCLEKERVKAVKKC